MTTGSRSVHGAPHPEPAADAGRLGSERELAPIPFTMNHRLLFPDVHVPAPSEGADDRFILLGSLRGDECLHLKRNSCPFTPIMGE